MDENRFLSLMKKARTHSYLGAGADYWHGYQRGLRRGYHGELFGTDREHELWLRLADEGTDKAERERGRGYRDGIKACSAEVDTQAAAGSPLARGSESDGNAPQGYSSRR